MINFSNEIKDYISAEIRELERLDIITINNVINEILNAYEKNGNIYIFGNGGSASTASHYANDFNKGISEFIDKKFNFICLNDNIPTIMAIANDIGYDDIFRFQLDGRLKINDLVIGISGSGNSKNVLKAITYAKSLKVKTIGITGFSGGELAKICDISLNVAVNSMQITEDIHMVFDHMIMTILKSRIYNKKF